MDCNPTKYEKEDFDINDTMLDVLITPEGLAKYANVNVHYAESYL